MEQRIASLEEEVKLLKNQIRTVLLDIKENLSSSDWQMAPGQNTGVDSPEEANQLLPESHSINSVKEESVSAAVKTPPPVEKVMYRAEEDTLVREQVYPSAPDRITTATMDRTAAIMAADRERPAGNNVWNL